ncbi:alpha/beta hydrolase [Planctomicrobium sp. SH664]|uniref:alpha/beta hydrolase n=1 Tax=Planctomicrobium sp. SH664 TaxID=3448125 RepID=UPI003F5B804A
MQRLLLAVVASLLSANMVLGQQVEIDLWPAGMPEPIVAANPPEEVVVGQNNVSRRFNISRPRLVVHVPPSGVARSGTGVIVVPGGGFTKLADVHEGDRVCAWLANQGIVAFKLLYRTPTNDHAQPNAGPVQDVQKGMMIVRERAREFELEPERIGLFGISSGGQASVIAATNPPTFSVEQEAISHRPDLLLLLYPFQIYDAKTKTLRPEIKIENGLPPTFIAQMGDDKGSLAQGSALLYLALIDRRIPAELHIYEKGGHGFGMNAVTDRPGTSDWQNRATDWLRLHGAVR